MRLPPPPARGVPPVERPAVEPLAQLYVSDTGAALRTLLGASHTHWIAVFHSLKTGLSNPVEGRGEEALACDSEIDADVVDFQTQAFRIRMVIGGRRTEWICDHLRQMRDGSVEAIEVKQHPSQMNPAYVRKIMEAREILAEHGWRVMVRYEADIVGRAARQINRANLVMDRSVRIGETGWEAFERLREQSPVTTFGALRAALHDRRVQGTAMANAVLASGRARTDLDRLIDDNSAVELLPAPRFLSRIRLA